MQEVPTADKYYVYSSGEVQASIAAALVDVDLKPAQPPTLEEMQGLNTMPRSGMELWSKMLVRETHSDIESEAAEDDMGKQEPDLQQASDEPDIARIHLQPRHAGGANCRQVLCL